jgi:hypothetical protein
MQLESPFMKILILAAITFLSATTVTAQGLVLFGNRVIGTTHVYAPLGPSDTTAIIGNTSNEGPPHGVTDYGARAPIGRNGSDGQFGARSTLAQLLGAPGLNAPESALLPAINPPSTFRTGVGAGSVAALIVTFNNIPQDAPVASFEMVAWDNSSGLYPSWSQASVAWAQGLIAAGKSMEFRILDIGGIMNPPPPLFPVNGDTTPELQSFSLYYIPEPATAALAGLGAAALLIFGGKRASR